MVTRAPFRLRYAPVAVVSTALACIGCNAILDIHEHSLAPANVDGGSSLEGGPDFPAPFAALYTVGRVPNEGGVGYLPEGGRATLSDDGFEPGGTLCSGTTCVTGAITP